MTTLEIDDRVAGNLRCRGLVPAMRGFNDYPSDSCVSVNEQVLHAPPSQRTLRRGDVVKIQTTARAPHAYANQGWSFAMGECEAETLRLVVTAHEALLKAVGVIRDHACVGDIGHAIQSHIEDAGFWVVRDYTGYAMGRAMLEAPQIPCYGRPGTGKRLRSGQIINVHVIAKAGHWGVEVGSDGWTATGKSDEPSALFTAMVLVHKDRAEPLSSMDIPIMQLAHAPLSAIARVCQIARDIRASGKSAVQLVHESGIRYHLDQFNEQAAAAVLQCEQALIDDWFAYSLDKRTSGGCYVIQEDEQRYVVGTLEGERLFFRDATTACACFVVRELHRVVHAFLGMQQ
jgi:methionyl aminopeptidase